MKLLAPLDQFRQLEADQAAHHAVMGNLLSLHVSIHQRGADPQEPGCGLAVIGASLASVSRLILPPLLSTPDRAFHPIYLPLRIGESCGSEDGHAGVQAPFRDGEPGGVGDLPDGDRMMDLPDPDSGAGIAGFQGPLWQLAKRGQIAVAGLEPDPPDRQENEPSQHDYDSGREVVAPDHPEVEVGV